MGTELHVHLHEDVIDSPEDILADFPFELGQSIISVQRNLVIIGLGSYDDTTTIQDWYLNRLDEVLSYYVVGD